MDMLKESLEASFRPLYLCEDVDVKFAILSVVEEALEESDRIRRFDMSEIEGVFDAAKEKAVALISAAREPAEKELLLPDPETLVKPPEKAGVPEPPSRVMTKIELPSMPDAELSDVKTRATAS